jgi:hypothetical protein
VIVLLGITPGDGRPLGPWIRAVSAGGLRSVLIREPVPVDEAVRIAVDALELVVVHRKCPDADAIASRWGLALHGPPIGPGSGASAHDEAEVDAALTAGAAYALLSPVWTPTSKPDDARPPLGLERFLAAAADRPVVALGGVTPERFRVLREHGAGAAILGPLTGDADAVTRSVRRFLR